VTNVDSEDSVLIAVAVSRSSFYPRNLLTDDLLRAVAVSALRWMILLDFSDAKDLFNSLCSM